MKVRFVGDNADLSERTYELLKEDILLGNVPPGSRLEIVDLARHLGVSRSPVKDALNRLAGEGLVEDVPRKGYFVPRLDPQDFVHLMQAALIIEIAALERGLPLMSAEDISAMWRLVVDMEQCVDADGRYLNYADFMSKNHEFHSFLVATARNPRLVNAYRSMRSHAAAMRMHYAAKIGDSRAAATIGEHRAVARAVDARDFAAVKATLVEHFEEAIRAFAPVYGGIREALLAITPTEMARG